jgi:hypothetical protein
MLVEDQMLDDGAGNVTIPLLVYVVIIVLVDLLLLPDNLSSFCGLMA